MNAYVTYTKGRYHDVVVDRIFNSEEKACQHVIATEFKDNSYYSNMPVDQLHADAKKYVDVFPIE